ncbi:hypothetical protein BJ508DRAFT_12177 [Ascobolus immersus RN42]|uniref:Uncharacterized protein n=1 Tax=Ascobolus immersus RN42 TaxID=1160509 RepID=A0A3N4HQ73_ASCIM|nr:hypothetical protein BJ508DRAFT_12177 [Ascobolus immersus RN42]
MLRFLLVFIMKRPTLLLSVPFLVSLFVDNAASIPLAQNAENIKRDLASDAESAEQTPEKCAALVASTLCFGAGPVIIPQQVAETLPIQSRDLPIHQRLYKRILGDWEWYDSVPNSILSTPSISRYGVRQLGDLDGGRRTRKHAFRKERFTSSGSSESGSDIEVIDDCICTREELEFGLCTCTDELLTPGEVYTTYPSTTIVFPTTTYILPTFTTISTGTPTLPSGTYIFTSSDIETVTSVPPATTDVDEPAPTATAEPVEPTETPTVPCGCTNDCKINGGEICPQFCDPKYLCPGDEEGDAPVLRKRGDDHGHDDGDSAYLSDSDLNDHYEPGSGNDQESYGSGHEDNYGSGHEDNYGSGHEDNDGSGHEDNYGSGPEDNYGPSEDSYGTPEPMYGQSDDSYAMGPPLSYGPPPSYGAPSQGSSQSQQQQSDQSHSKGGQKGIKHIPKAPKAPKIKAQGVVSDIIHQRLKEEKKGHKSPSEEIAHRLHGYKSHPAANSAPRHGHVERDYVRDEKVTVEVDHGDSRTKTTIEKPAGYGSFAKTTSKFDDGPRAGGFVLDNKRTYTNGRLVEDTRIDMPTMQLLTVEDYENSAGTGVSPLGLVHPANPTQAAAILGETPTHNVVFDFDQNNRMTTDRITLTGPGSGYSNSGYDSDGDGYESEFMLLAQAFPDDFQYRSKPKLRERIQVQRRPVIHSSPVIIEETTIITKPSCDHGCSSCDHGCSSHGDVTIIDRPSCPYADEHDCSSHQDVILVEEKNECPYKDEHDCSSHEEVIIGEPVIVDKHIDHVEIGKPIIINANHAHSSIIHGDEECPHKAKHEPCPYEAAGLLCPHVSRHVDVAAHKVEIGEPVIVKTEEVHEHEPIIVKTEKVHEIEHHDDHDCIYKKYNNPCPDEVAGRPCSHTKIFVSEPRVEVGEPIIVKTEGHHEYEHEHVHEPVIVKTEGHHEYEHVHEPVIVKSEPVIVTEGHHEYEHHQEPVIVKSEPVIVKSEPIFVEPVVVKSEPIIVKTEEVHEYDYEVRKEPIIIETEVKEYEHHDHGHHHGHDHDDCPFKKSGHSCPDEDAGRSCTHHTVVKAEVVTIEDVQKVHEIHEHHPDFSDSDSDSDEEWHNVPARHLEVEIDHDEAEFRNHDHDKHDIDQHIKLGDDDAKDGAIKVFAHQEEKHEAKEEHHHEMDKYDSDSDSDGPEPVVVMSPW